MSRIGNKPVPLNSAVNAVLDKSVLTLKSTLGEIAIPIDSRLNCVISSDQIAIECNNKDARAIWGTVRALVANAVRGLVEPWSVTVEMHGVGYKVKQSGNTLTLHAGMTPIEHQVSSHVKVNCPTATQIVLTCYNKEWVGQAAADIIAYRKPDKYKGYGFKRIA